MRSHLDALQTTTSVNFRRLADDFHSVAKQASFRVAFRIDFGRFWRPKWTPKFDFRGIFFDIFFDCVLASIFGGFLEAREKSVKNNVFPIVFANFQKIDVFKKVAKKL